VLIYYKTAPSCESTGDNLLTAYIKTALVSRVAHNADNFQVLSRALIALQELKVRLSLNVAINTLKMSLLQVVDFMFVWGNYCNICPR
jgi:hypothetical protein